MRVLRTIEELAPFQGGAFVPTMGALHAGHAALIEQARSIAGGVISGGVVSGGGSPVVVSIFVNPTQFGPNEDFSRYPRTFEADREVAAGAGADAVFAPDVETMYPSPPHPPTPEPPLPPVATMPLLEDACRPGHLAGVCQVVARLFDLVRPRWAVFGEKDYQQLRTIEAMVAMQNAASTPRWPGLEIVAHPTVREPDGLAMSSRNRYLNETDRPRALGLFRALQEARSLAAPGRPTRRIEEAMRAVLVRHGLDVQYAVVRDALTLMPIDMVPRPGSGSSARALIAARLGDVRLIDNVAIG